jgi:hypothetical protein
LDCCHRQWCGCALASHAIIACSSHSRSNFQSRPLGQTLLKLYPNSRPCCVLVDDKYWVLSWTIGNKRHKITMPVAPHNNISHLHVKVPRTTYSAFTSAAGLADDSNPVTFPPPGEVTATKSPSAAMLITRTRRILTKTGQFLTQRELMTQQVWTSTKTPLTAPQRLTLTRRRS